MATIDVTARSAAAPERVWSLLADVSTWSTWSSFDESDLQQPAPTGDPNGTGAIRAFRLKRMRSREEVVEFDPPHRFAYRLLEGIPVNDYLAVVTLTPDGDGTSINWHSTFRAARGLPTWLVAPRLKRFITTVAGQLAAAAATPAGS
jgi:uncharacterized protein YndB with AHSA1/START domain